jgi:hypothetical protein
MDSTHTPYTPPENLGYYGCFFTPEEAQHLQHDILDKGQDEIYLLRVVLKRLLAYLKQKGETLNVNDTLKVYMMILRCAAGLSGLLRMNASLSIGGEDESLQRLLDAFEEQDEEN